MLMTPPVMVKVWLNGLLVQFWTLYPLVYGVKPAVGSAAADAFPTTIPSGVATAVSAIAAYTGGAQDSAMARPVLRRAQAPTVAASRSSDASASGSSTRYRIDRHSRYGQ